jgi:hypothetical protein
MKDIKDMMEDYDLLVAEADATTLRDWVRQALYIMHSETVEAVVEKIEQEVFNRVATFQEESKGKDWIAVMYEDRFESLRTELLGKKEI